MSFIARSRSVADGTGILVYLKCAGGAGMGIPLTRDILRAAQKLHGGCAQMSSPITIYATMMHHVSFRRACSGIHHGCPAQLCASSKCLLGRMVVPLVAFIGLPTHAHRSCIFWAHSGRAFHRLHVQVLPDAQKALDESACMSHLLTKSPIVAQTALD